jgi:hypothetical protein
MGESFWQNNSFVTYILFELQPINIFSPVADFGDQSLDNKSFLEWNLFIERNHRVDDHKEDKKDKENKEEKKEKNEKKDKKDKNDKKVKKDEGDDAESQETTENQNEGKVLSF